MDSAVVQVEAEGLGGSFSQGQRGGALGGVGEPHELGQTQRPVGTVQVTQDPTRADRGKLLVITDEPHAAACAGHELDGGVQGQRVGHPRFVDHDQRLCVDVGRPGG